MVGAWHHGAVIEFAPSRAKAEIAAFPTRVGSALDPELRQRLHEVRLLSLYRDQLRESAHVWHLVSSPAMRDNRYPCLIPTKCRDFTSYGSLHWTKSLAAGLGTRWKQTRFLPQV